MIDPSNAQWTTPFRRCPVRTPSSLPTLTSTNPEALATPEYHTKITNDITFSLIDEGTNFASGSDTVAGGGDMSGTEAYAYSAASSRPASIWATKAAWSTSTWSA